MNADKEKVEEIVQAATERAVQAVNEQVIPVVENAISSIPQMSAEPSMPDAADEPETDHGADALALALAEARAEDAERRAAEANRAAQESARKAEELRIFLSEFASKFETQQRGMAELSRRIDELERVRTHKEAHGEDEETGGHAVFGSVANVGMSEYDNADNAGFENPHAYEVIVSGAGEGGGSGNKVCCYVPKYSGLLLAGPFCGPHIGNDQSIYAPESAGPYAGGAVWAGSNPPTGADCSWSHFGWREIGTIPEGTEVQQRVVYAKFEIPCEPQGPTETEEEQKVRGPKLVEIGMKENADWINLVKDSWKARDPSCGVRQRLVPIALVANSIVTQLTMTPYFDCVPKCCIDDSPSPSSSSPESPSPSESPQPTSCSCPTGTIAEFGGMRIYNNVLQYATVRKEFEVDETTGCCKLVTGEKEWTDLLNFKDCEA